MASLLCPAAGLGERVPQDVPGGGWSRAGEAGQEGRTGVADQRDPANRLRTESCASQSFLPRITGTINSSAVIIVCIFLIFLCVPHLASFVKHIVSAVLLKIIKKKKLPRVYSLLSPTWSAFIEQWQPHVQLGKRAFWGYPGEFCKCQKPFLTCRKSYVMWKY